MVPDALDTLTEFPWEVPTAGYRWIKAGYTEPDGRVVIQAVPLLTDDIPFDPAHRYERRLALPLQEDPGLFRRFAALSGQTAIRTFANAYGWLGEGRFTQRTDGTVILGEPLRLWQREIAAMRWVLHHRSQRDLARVQERLNPRLDGRISARLLRDPDRVRGRERLAFRLVPRTLLAALWLQLGRVLAGSVGLKPCSGPGCERWIEIGGPTGHRQDKDTCSDRCRQRYHRQNREKKRSTT